MCKIVHYRPIHNIHVSKNRVNRNFKKRLTAQGGPHSTQRHACVLDDAAFYLHHCENTSVSNFNINQNVVLNGSKVAALPGLIAVSTSALVDKYLLTLLPLIITTICNWRRNTDIPLQWRLTTAQYALLNKMF